MTPTEPQYHDEAAVRAIRAGKDHAPIRTVQGEILNAEKAFMLADAAVNGLYRILEPLIQRPDPRPNSLPAEIEQRDAVPREAPLVLRVADLTFKIETIARRLDDLRVGLALSDDNEPF